MNKPKLLLPLVASFVLVACSGIGSPARSVATDDRAPVTAKKPTSQSKASPADTAKDTAGKEAASLAAKEAAAKEAAAKEAQVAAQKEVAAKEVAAKEAAAKESTTAKESTAFKIADKPVDKSADKSTDKTASTEKGAKVEAKKDKAEPIKIAASSKKDADDEADDSNEGSVFQKGIASWYGTFFHGRLTANGERYDKWAMTAAHRTLPFGTKLKVTYPKTGRSVVVRVNDRGPYIPPRIIDLSQGAAEKLGIHGIGHVVLTKLN